MKRITEVFGICPPHAALLEGKSVRTVADLAHFENLESLAASTGIEGTLLQEYQAFAQLELEVFRSNRWKSRWFVLVVVFVISFMGFVAFQILRHR